MMFQRWIAPMRHASHRSTEQRRRTKQFCSTVQSTAACSDLPISSGRENPEENASCCHPDKRTTQRKSEIGNKSGSSDGSHGSSSNKSLDRVPSSMARLRIRLAELDDCNALGKMHYQFRTETESATEN